MVAGRERLTAPPRDGAPSGDAACRAATTRPEPRRTCIGCRRRAPQSDLVRVVRGDDGSLLVGRQLPGRGAWLCRDSPDCFRQAVRRRAFGRALRAPLASGAVERLAEQLAGRPA